MWLKCKFAEIMKRIIFILLVTITVLTVQAQQNHYKDSLQVFINDYIQKHEVVKGDDKKLLQFYPVDEGYSVVAKFVPVKKSEWFNVATSSGRTKAYRQFGKIIFTIHDTLQTLFVYQSRALLQKQEYWDYLFLPFTDRTTGAETYETGRYIDLKMGDIENNKVVIDFNKAYNPYCAYVSGVYNCPVPPRENTLAVAIQAGEKKYRKQH
jgi:uncharacterized protein